MNDSTPRSSPTPAPRADQTFPVLTPARVARIAVRGHARRVAPGEVLVEAGEKTRRFFVVTEGQVELVRISGALEEIVAVCGVGQFTGEVNMLSGRPGLLRLRASEPSEVLELDRDHLLELVQTDSELSDIFMRAFILRRVELIARGLGEVLVGSSHSPGTLRIKEFLTRNGHPYSFVDVERDASMSRYLIRRIEENPAIVLRTHTEIVALEGSDHLEHVRWRDTQTGTIETHDIQHVFVMMGAVPNTRWLDNCVVLDANGFIKTGPDLSQDELASAHWPLARAPYLLESSRPGVFAVGDVRADNLKRVASAVGEGSNAVAFVHQVLNE